MATSTLSAAHAYDDSSTWKVIDFIESFISQLNSCMMFLPGGLKNNLLVAESSSSSLQDYNLVVKKQLAELL